MKQQDFNQVYSERENIKSLIKYLSEKIKSSPEPKVGKEILIQKNEAINRLLQVEGLLSQAGLPAF